MAAFLDRRFRKQRPQLAGLVHLAHDVRAADELAVHVELRDRRPVRVVFDALANLWILQDVNAEEIFDAAVFFSRMASQLKQVWRATSGSPVLSKRNRAVPSPRDPDWTLRR